VLGIVEHPVEGLFTTTEWLPAETFKKVNGRVPGTGAPPSNEKVYGPAKADTVETIIVPVFAPAHAVAVDETVEVGMLNPTPTKVVTLQPKTSVMLTQCVPGDKLMNE
jgi:hypothetical protein